MSIQTTLVGSYPTPEWLCPQPTERALQNARWVVIPIQEQARIDLLTDYALSRIDVNHPETNGMIEYFVRPLSGIRSAITRR
jgi:5-methyltetrahydropteroyltriglutamate--homocysteine methyltransferase